VSKRRLMHHDQGRPRRLGSQHAVEPLRGRLVDLAVMQAGKRDVERHDAHRSAVDDVMHRPHVRQIAVIPKGLAKGVAVVVVARDDERRHLQAVDQLAQLGVFGRRSLLDQIAA
jgi:hypothetical protein